jgi:WD repeat-containing protein 23
MMLLRSANFTNVTLGGVDDEDDAGPLWGLWGGRRRRRREPKNPDRFPDVPSPEGAKLMRSGRFGSIDDDTRTRKNVALRALDRELGIGGPRGSKKAGDLLVQVIYDYKFPSSRIKRWLTG